MVKFLLLISGIVILLWGIGDGGYEISRLVSFPWNDFSSQVTLFIDIIFSSLLALLFIFAGIGGILTFVHAKSTRVYRINKYATIIFTLAFIAAILRAIYLIVETVQQKSITSLPMEITQLIFDLLLPLIYLWGARLVRKSLR